MLELVEQRGTAHSSPRRAGGTTLASDSCPRALPARSRLDFAHEPPNSTLMLTSRPSPSLPRGADSHLQDRGDARHSRSHSLVEHSHSSAIVAQMTLQRSGSA